MTNRKARLMTGDELPVRRHPQPMNAADKIRADALAVTGGRATIASPMTPQCDEFPHEQEIQTKTRQPMPSKNPYVPKRTLARDPAGPPVNTNLTQITSDAKGQVNTTEWMHGWFGHSCHCGEDE